jgi:hypothetical protein
LQKSVGGVWPRISSANALQKERSGSSERGPSSERKSAGETVGGRVERKDGASRTHREGGRGSAQGSGWREITIQRFKHHQKWCVSRGTRVVRTTGSYEESLSMEGIPDHHEASAFTSGRQRWSRQFSHPPTRTDQPKGGRMVKLQLPRRRERREGEPKETATGVSEARSHQRRGKKTPTLVTLSIGRETKEHEFSVR